MAEMNKALYQELVLEHNKNPHNFGELDLYTDMQLGHNASCGDKLTLYLRFVDNKVQNISFQGEGCAIFKASCSMMTDAVMGKTKEQVAILIKDIEQVVMNGESSSPEQEDRLGKLILFRGVKQFPARVKCALLGFRTLEKILETKYMMKKEQ